MNETLAKLHADNQSNVTQQRQQLQKQLNDNLNLMEEVSILRVTLQNQSAVLLKSFHHLSSLQTSLNAIDEIAQNLQAIIQHADIEPEKVSVTQPITFSPPKTSSDPLFSSQELNLFDETIFDLDDTNTKKRKAEQKRYSKKPKLYQGTLEPIEESSEHSSELCIRQRPRRSATRVHSYTEPALNSKLRKGDPYTYSI